MAWASGVTAGLLFLGVLAFQFLPPSLAPEPHAHSAAPHDGQLAEFAAGATHLHVEFVVEPTGVVRLSPYDETAARPLAVESQSLVFSVQPLPDGEIASVMLRALPEEGRTDGLITRFVGRLPAWTVGGPLRVRFTEFRVGGERFRFEFDWQPPSAGEAFRAAFEEDQRRLFSSPGGSYTAADIRANGGRPADAAFARAAPAHDHSPKAGDRVCPISGFKAEPKFAWVVGGQTYWFCCQPCVDEFVLVAKERPGEVKAEEEYTHRER